MQKKYVTYPDFAEICKKMQQQANYAADVYSHETDVSARNYSAHTDMPRQWH